MSLHQTLKGKLLECRKAGKALELTILQVVLGDASTLEARSGRPPSDDEVEKLIRKTMLGNQETLGLLEKQGQAGSANHVKLTAENAYLATLLPQTLSADEIRAALAEVLDGIKSARNEGQATGVAMKHLKGRGLKVLGEDVATAVRQIRG
jgi:uncharacterized protein YqeY